MTFRRGFDCEGKEKGEGKRNSVTCRGNSIYEGPEVGRNMAGLRLKNSKPVTGNTRGFFRESSNN